MEDSRATSKSTALEARIRDKAEEQVTLDDRGEKDAY